MRLDDATRVIVNAEQDHFRPTIARRSAVTSRPSLLKVSIRAFESSRSRNILSGEPLLPAGAKNTRIFRRLFAASGRGDTKATRSMLRTVPLGKQTSFSLMSDCKACDFIRQREFNPSDNTNGSHLRRAALFVAGRPRGLVSVEKRFIVGVDEKLTAFLELEAATAGRSKSSTGRCNGKSR